MKRNRLTVEHYIGILMEHEAGTPVSSSDAITESEVANLRSPCYFNLEQNSDIVVFTLHVVQAPAGTANDTRLGGDMLRQISTSSRRQQSFLEIWGYTLPTFCQVVSQSLSCQTDCYLYFHQSHQFQPRVPRLGTKTSS